MVKQIQLLEIQIKRHLFLAEAEGGAVLSNLWEAPTNTLWFVFTILQVVTCGTVSWQGPGTSCAVIAWQRQANRSPLVPVGILGWANCLLATHLPFPHISSANDDKLKQLASSYSCIFTEREREREAES